MHLLITQRIFGDVHTISIPIDAIFVISLLICFTVIGYCFNNILGNETNQLPNKRNIDSNSELVKKQLEDQLRVEVNKLNQKISENSSIKNQNFLIPSKLLGIGSLAFVGIGGASFIGLELIQKSYEGVNSSLKNIKIEQRSTKSPLSMTDLKALEKAQTNIKKINYTHPFLSTIKSSKSNYDYQVKQKQIENNFSF